MMMEMMYELAAFVLKAGIVVFAVMFIAGFLVQVSQRQKVRKGELVIDRLSDDLRDGVERLRLELLDKKQRKKAQKSLKQQQKQLAKESPRKRIFVIDFKGGVDANEVESLRREVNAIVAVAEPGEQVFVRLESSGGAVDGYGLGAAQLARLRDAELEVIVSVDKVAASGGYMMAVVGNHIQAAPFAVIGSIGVVAQLPNFHRLLKKHDVDYEVLTAGEYKRTLTVFGENTEKGREKFIEELEDTHELFKSFVSEYRPQLDLDKVATGEVWFGRKALDEKLVDAISTSDDYLYKLCQDNDVYELHYEVRLGDRKSSCR